MPATIRLRFTATSLRRSQIRPRNQTDLITHIAAAADNFLSTNPTTLAIFACCIENAVQGKGRKMEVTLKEGENITRRPFFLV